MSHNIYKKMVYSFEKPMWHNLTEPSTVPMTAEGIMNDRFGGGFSIELRPITLILNDEEVETGDFGIVRGASEFDEKEIVLGYCSERYKPLQPMDVARAFDTKVKEFAETMAFLGEGGEMFISWKMPSFDVRVGDSLDMYGIVRVGFNTLKGARLFTSVYRPVCHNTITLAESWAKANTDGFGRGNVWKGKGVNKNLLRDLGYWMNHVQSSAITEALQLQNLFGRFTEIPINSDEKAYEILYRAYPPAEDISDYYPKELKADKKETTHQFNKKQEALRDGIFGMFSGGGTEITPDFWGMMNSTSEYFCHVMPSKKPIAESVMFGGRQRYIAQMANTLSEMSA